MKLQRIAIKANKHAFVTGINLVTGPKILKFLATFVIVSQEEQTLQADRYQMKAGCSDEGRKDEAIDVQKVKAFQFKNAGFPGETDPLKSSLIHRL